MLEHALRLHCSERAQTPVRIALFEEVRMEGELVVVYSSLIRSVLEYAIPFWANLPEYLSLLIEGVQKKALEIIFPGLPYRDALSHFGLRILSDRRAAACIKFIQRVRDTGVLADLLPLRTTVSHGYNIRSGTIREDPAMASNNRLDKIYIQIFLVKCFMIMYIRGSSRGASISHTWPRSQPFPE